MPACRYIVIYGVLSEGQESDDRVGIDQFDKSV
jgi:hypothetical protein